MNYTITPNKNNELNQAIEFITPVKYFFLYEQVKNILLRH